MQITGTVTRKANGAIEIQPSDAGTFTKLPAMGDEVSFTVEVTRTAADVEKAVATSKKERAVIPAEEPRAELSLDERPIASAPVAERRARK